MSAVDAVDEAVSVLRRTPASLWVWYYAGTLPFLLALISMLSAPPSSLAADSLLVASLFLWMNAAQSVFASRLRDVIAGEPDPAHLHRRLPSGARTSPPWCNRPSSS